MTEAQLRKSYERILAYRAESGGDRTACPSIEELQALVERQGPEAVRLERLDHVMSCPFCREEFELLRTVRGAAVELTISTRTLALAASVVLVLGAALVWRLGGRVADTPRGGAEPIVLHSPADGATLPGAPTFVWRPVADAHRYRVELLRPDGTMVWKTELSDTTGAPPDPSLLEPGIEYRWLVEVEASGGVVERSEMHRFSLRGP